ncbi:hypothetical protein JBL43_12335 [Aureibaculum sp. A20]|uniref:DUF5723 domain-containing protein n=1 Tax=Aureibaculum flavum TaxID=2795986 RepID=A0ABS0WST7_9FLAO|nr:DUF5723 family protein [Aureibaculum flavum]MBJ2175031.1 hypothetical protein [Aureibaculum flavum]
MMSQSYAQNKKFIFGNNDIPQSLMVNPGAEANYRKHIGIPLFSGIYVNVGSNNLTITDVLAKDGIDINDKLRNQLFRMKATDFVTVNEQLDIINIGYKLHNDRDYLNFGFYQEFDFVAYYPKELTILFYQGNTDENGNINLNNTTNFNELNFKGQAFGVFHAGISRKINNKLNVGIRAKLYSGIFNVQSVNNKGNFKSVLGENNVYQHELNNIDFLIQSSGLIKNDEFALSGKSIFSNMFLGGNLGLGVDAGFTYNLNDKLKISASLLDVGFISYSKDISSYKVSGNYELEGVGLIIPENDPIPYWEDLRVDFDEQVERKEVSKTYFSFPSAKFNASVHYGFGKQIRKYTSIIDCHTNNGFSQYNYQNELGVQLYSIFRPKLPQTAATVYYSRRISNFLQTKVTYTLDSYSFSNIGIGFAARIRKFSLYASVDNVLGYKDLYDSKKMSLSLGMNLIFD